MWLNKSIIQENKKKKSGATKLKKGREKLISEGEELSANYIGLCTILFYMRFLENFADSYNGTYYLNLKKE